MIKYLIMKDRQPQEANTDTYLGFNLNTFRKFKKLALSDDDIRGTIDGILLEHPDYMGHIDKVFNAFAFQKGKKKSHESGTEDWEVKKSGRALGWKNRGRLSTRRFKTKP